KIDRPATTSILQGASRHNTFIALAVTERLFGEQGLALAAIATAVLVPFTNLAVVSLMGILLSPRHEAGLGKNILRELLRNPFIVSILCGIGLNLAGIGEVPVLTDASAIVGRAALPLVLLCIGASLRVQPMGPIMPRVYAASAIKLLVFPMLVGAGIALLRLTPLEGLILMIYAAAPTSSAAYALARHMGGDALLMANIITFQTMMSLLSLPLTLWLTAYWMDFPF
ncbi:MAG: AEC family transporter, partial [Gammaproteobacteria bacterium]|nr:AEC family transporter [Gammaproteobacteria bacterium]